MLAVNKQTKHMSVYMIECLGGDPMSASKDTSGWNYQYLWPQQCEHRPDHSTKENTPYAFWTVTWVFNVPPLY